MEERLFNHVKVLRVAEGLTQAALARRAGVSRAAVGAIEQRALTPSVEAALRIARALGKPVDEVFSLGDEAGGITRGWAWAAKWPARFWQARVGDRLLHIPVESTAQGMLPHDGVSADGSVPCTVTADAERTLVIACCDPAVSLLLSIYASRTGYRVICLHRSSRQAVSMLRDGLVHLAGIHLQRADAEGGNAASGREILGEGFSLVHVARWEAGVALSRTGFSSMRALRGARLRWVGREEGSGARACQDEVLGSRPVPRHTAPSHRAVVDAVRGGWADAGVSLRLVCEEAGLPFLPVRRECYDLCVRTDQAGDPRVAGLLETIRSKMYQEAIRPLPGYEPAPHVGEVEAIV